MTGLVSLVGAGPGDPELLTLKAARRLAEANLVLYDALVEADTLAFAVNARRFFVGKRAGRPAIRQDAINRLMIREAHRGHRIVRLKCGDPFVFGRGGEEALALAAAGVACEIIPGVSSALAAPLLAGIPVTKELLDTSEEVEVLGIRIPVLPPTPIMIAKLQSFSEHYCDLEQPLLVVRAVREQLDWAEIRKASQDHPFAEAFLFLLERLGIIAPF